MQLLSRKDIVRTRTMHSADSKNLGTAYAVVSAYESGASRTDGNCYGWDFSKTYAADMQSSTKHVKPIGRIVFLWHTRYIHTDKNAVYSVVANRL